MKSKLLESSGATLLAAVVAIGLCGCAARRAQTVSSSITPTVTAPATTWVETQLYFGLGPAGVPVSGHSVAGNAGQGISEAQWRSFLDREVTPRFPDGFTVVDAYGQWKGAGEKVPERLRSKLLILVHPDTREDSARIEAIRSAWKRLTGDKSVLNVTTPAAVSF